MKLRVLLEYDFRDIEGNPESLPKPVISQMARVVSESCRASAVAIHETISPDQRFEVRIVRTWVPEAVED